MGSRRFFLASLTAALALTATSGPALAKKPGPTVPDDRPPTAQERAASDRKAAAAERNVASTKASGGDLASLACAVPTSTGSGEPEAATSDAASQAGANVAPLACVVPQGFLAVEARDQINGWYCGPAVGQVIANYSWATPAGANRFLQRDIASWMSTDINGGTGSWNMERGLETATWGSPRRPANWDWVVTRLEDTDRDGWVGDQLDAYVRSNISHSRMPLAISVKPYAPDSPSGAHLSSWLQPVWSVGHWVSIYGWMFVHDGTDRARMYFTDSSRDEGGWTGKYWTPTRWFTLMILEHTRLIVW
ncbi:MAG: hypothetical protein ACXWWL_03270 [Candidatus Limnocylindria bacterium]